MYFYYVTAFIQIEQSTRDLTLYTNEDRTKHMVAAVAKSSSNDNGAGQMKTINMEKFNFGAVDDQL